MMNIRQLKSDLLAVGYNPHGIDGIYDLATRTAIMQMFTDGPDTLVGNADLRRFADANGLALAQVKAVCQIEANGAGFFDGEPKILPEPHRFSKATCGQFDKSHPDVSYPMWGTRPYPPTQAARYQQLLTMIGLDPDAGFASASYGKFQIMGENAGACGFVSSMAFAYAMSRDEQHQLDAFGRFLKATGLLAKLRAGGTDPTSWCPFAAGYNGTAYRLNNYHTKLARAYVQFGGS